MINVPFHFLRPQWLWLIPILLGIVVLFYWYNKQKNPWLGHCDASLLDYLQIDFGQQQYKKAFLALALGWIITAVALAGPTWRQLPQPIYHNEAARVIVLDLSQHMLATDIKPNRLARAKFKIIDLLKSLADGSIGLVVFADDAYTVTPLTTDRRTVQYLLSVLKPSLMPATGENLAQGLQQALHLLQNQHSKYGDILLLTAANTSQSDAEAIATQIHQSGYTLSVLGVGSGSGAPIPAGKHFARDATGKTILSKLDEVGLQRLATTGGGHYYRIRADDNNTNALVQHLARQREVIHQDQHTVQIRWQDQGYCLVWLLLPLVCLGFRRGVL